MRSMNCWRRNERSGGAVVIRVANVHKTVPTYLL